MAGDMRNLKPVTEDNYMVHKDSFCSKTSLNVSLSEEGRMATVKRFQTGGGYAYLKRKVSPG